MSRHPPCQREGHFFAGLALNRLVPNEGLLMDRIAFFGGAVFIPVFLVSVGFILDPAVMLEGETLGLAGLFAAVGFFLLGLGPLAGEAGSFLGAGLALLGSLYLYQRLRPRLALIPAPSAPPKVDLGDQPTAYGRTKGGGL